MKPIRKDSEVQVTPNNMDDEKCRNLRYNVLLIGWMGLITSLTIVMCAGVTLQRSDDVARVMLQLLRKNTAQENSRFFMRRFVVMIGAGLYSLALMNIVACSLLLLGIALHWYKMLLPWLLYHGFLIGITVHMAMYLTVSGMLVDFKAFAVILAAFSMTLVVFFKISYEVFLLYKIHRYDEEASSNKNDEVAPLPQCSNTKNIVPDRSVMEIASDA